MTSATGTTTDTTAASAQTAPSPIPATASIPAPADAIPDLRAQIDAMDAAIVRLVAERARLSSRVQAARMSAGGTRVELGRERVILETYRAALGPNGPALADSILQVCRGTR